MSGARFGYWIGDTGRLALALYRYALDRLAAKGFVTVLPPVLVREKALIGTGAFPSDEQNIYAIPEDGLYLSGTAEIPLASLHAGEILDADELPLRYVAFSPCFRREAGAAGQDTRGMFRVHQFNKVEQFALTLPEQSWDEHELLLANTEELVRELGVPYRVVVLPGRRHVGGVREDVRRRDLVPEPGPLPRDRLGLEHDRLPGAPARHPLPRREEPRAAAHAQRHRRRRPDGARDPREPPGRGAGRAARVRRARARHSLAASHSFASRFCARVSHASSTRSRSSSRSSRSSSGIRMSTAE